MHISACVRTTKGYARARAPTHAHMRVRHADSCTAGELEVMQQGDADEFNQFFKERCSVVKVLQREVGESDEDFSDRVLAGEQELIDRNFARARVEPTFVNLNVNPKAEGFDGLLFGSPPPRSHSVC